MQRLSQVQAGNLINQAWNDVRKYHLSKFGFGQSLFNLLPTDICHHIVGTDMDFFHQANDEKALEMFYSNCVNVEENCDE